VYEADGFCIKECYDNKKNKHVYVDQDLCYYDFYNNFAFKEIILIFLFDMYNFVYKYLLFLYLFLIFFNFIVQSITCFFFFTYQFSSINTRENFN
jgi:hypothetical protein